MSMSPRYISVGGMFAIVKPFSCPSQDYAALRPLAEKCADNFPTMVVPMPMDQLEKWLLKHLRDHQEVVYRTDQRSGNLIELHPWSSEDLVILDDKDGNEWARMQKEAAYRQDLMLFRVFPVPNDRTELTIKCGLPACWIYLLLVIWNLEQICPEIQFESVTSLGSLTNETSRVRRALQAIWTNLWPEAEADSKPSLQGKQVAGEAMHLLPASETQGWSSPQKRRKGPPRIEERGEDELQERRDKVQQYRKILNLGQLTQEQAAKKVGHSRHTLHTWENHPLIGGRLGNISGQEVN